MGKRKRHNVPTTIGQHDVKGRLPKGARYDALKGMGYTPSVRDQNKRQRKQAKQDLKRKGWDE